MKKGIYTDIVKESSNFKADGKPLNIYNIIYLAHGYKHFLEEAYFSLLSLCNNINNKNYKIHIYTDHPEFFQNFDHLNINYIVLNKEKITLWKGENNFNHRLKIKVLKDFCERFPNEKYLFLDSDTYVASPLNYLFDNIKHNQFVLDHNEGLLTQKKRTHIKSLYEFLVNNEGLGIKLEPELHMWNSGVIGLDYSNHEILDKILETTDLLTRHINSHILEQFAFAYHFQIRGKVKNASDLIHHYWYFKEMRKFISDFIEENKNKNLDEQFENVSNLNPQSIGAEKWNYKQSDFWSKIMFRLTHFRKWKPILK